MNIYAEKLEIMKLVLETNNTEILNAVKSLFRKQSPPDFWDTLTNSQKSEILEGIKQVEECNYVDYEEFIKKYR